MNVVTNSRIEEWHHVTFSVNHGKGLFSTLDCYIKLNGSVLQLDRAFVIPEHRKERVFTALVAEAEKFCKDRKLLIEVWPANNTPYLVSFFERRGYVLSDDGYYYLSL